MKCILITSIGSLSGTGIAMCLTPVRSSLRIVATNSIAEAPGNFLSDRTVIVPSTTDADAWLAAVKRIVEKERPHLVLNGRDEELPLLGKLRDENQVAEIRYLCPPAELAAIFNDKYETAKFAREHELPFAETAYSDREVKALLARHGLPLVAKPRQAGFGSRGVFLACDEAQVRAALDTGSCVFQEVLPCPVLAESLSAWNQQTGIPWVASIKSIDHEVDLILDDGVVALCMTYGLAEGAFNRDLRLVEDPIMKSVGQAYGNALAKLGHRGPINLQGRLLPDGRYVPFELNARFTGTMPGKAYLGYNMVLAALKHWCDVPSGEVSLAPSGNAVWRAPIFMQFDAAAAKSLAEQREWRRS